MDSILSVIDLSLWLCIIIFMAMIITKKYISTMILKIGIMYSKKF